MGSKGTVFKACKHDDEQGRRRSCRDCPELARRNHGSWHFDCRVRDLWGRSQQVRRGGFPTRAAAERARDVVQGESAERYAGATWTVARWLRYLLTTRTRIRPTTLHGYTQQVETHLIPRLGPVRLADLNSRQLGALFADLATVKTATATRLPHRRSTASAPPCAPYSTPRYARA